MAPLSCGPAPCPSLCSCCTPARRVNGGGFKWLGVAMLVSEFILQSRHHNTTQVHTTITHTHLQRTLLRAQSPHSTGTHETNNHHATTHVTKLPPLTLHPPNTHSAPPTHTFIIESGEMLRKFPDSTLTLLCTRATARRSALSRGVRLCRMRRFCKEEVEEVDKLMRIK